MPALDLSSIGIFAPIAGSGQTVNYDGSVATANAFTGQTLFEVTVTTGCHMKIGTNPVATKADHYLTPNIPRQFPMVSGSKVAFIKADGSTPGVARVGALKP